MSITQLEEEVKNLTPAEQDRLAAYLFVLRQRRDLEYERKLAERIDDRDPSHWVSLEELEKRWKD